MKPVKQKAWTAKRRAEFETELKALMLRYGVRYISSCLAGEIDGYVGERGVFTASRIVTGRPTGDLRKWRV